MVSLVELYCFSRYGHLRNICTQSIRFSIPQAHDFSTLSPNVLMSLISLSSQFCRDISVASDASLVPSIFFLKIEIFPVSLSLFDVSLLLNVCALPETTKLGFSICLADRVSRGSLFPVHRRVYPEKATNSKLTTGLQLKINGKYLLFFA